MDETLLREYFRTKLYGEFQEFKAAKDDDVYDELTAFVADEIKGITRE